MAIYRQIHTCFWEDDKMIDDLNLEEKFFYLYLLTNQKVKQCGCYDISFKKITLETSFGKNQIEKMLDDFENKYNLIKYNKKTKEILLLNFYKYNWTKSPKVKSCIEKEAKEIKNKEFADYINEKIGYRYGIDTVSIPLGEEEKEKEKEKEKKEEKREREINKERDSVASAPAPTLFDVISFGNDLDVDKKYCERFFNHYEAVGWVNGNNQKIKNWKLVLKNWISKDKKDVQKEVRRRI